MSKHKTGFKEENKWLFSDTFIHLKNFNFGNIPLEAQ